VKVDPAALLRCWAVDVDVGAHTYTIPAHPATVWMERIIEGTYDDIVPGMVAERGDDIDDELMAGTVQLAELTSAARAALAAAAGMKWWTAERMAYLAANTWIAGELLLRGVDPQHLSLAAYLSAAYRAATRVLDTAKRAKLDMDLERPPTGVSPDEWFDPEEAARGFMAAMGTAAPAGD
jgi:hypothetical protein